MDLILHAAAFVVGLGVGAAGYRYLLKRDPEKLEAWAKAIKDKAARKK